MGVAKNEEADANSNSVLLRLSLGGCGRLSSSSSSCCRWVKRLIRTSPTSMISLKRSFTRAFFNYRYNKQGRQSDDDQEQPFLKKRKSPDAFLELQNAAEAAYNDCWIRRWQPLPDAVTVAAAAFDKKKQAEQLLPVASAGAMALMARYHMGHSHSLRLIRKSTSLVTWA